MKKSELVRLAIANLRILDPGPGNTYICSAIKWTGAICQQHALAQEIVEELMEIIAPDKNSPKDTFYQYAVKELNLPHKAREQDNFMQFLRLKFMEMLIETYELKGE